MPDNKLLLALFTLIGSMVGALGEGLFDVLVQKELSKSAKEARQIQSLPFRGDILVGQIP